MGSQIIKQPDGRYAVWSSVVDDFTIVDATAAEIVEEFSDRSRREVAERVNQIISAVERGERPYHQFTQSFEECVERIRELHGGGTETLKHFGLGVSPPEETG